VLIQLVYGVLETRQGSLKIADFPGHDYQDLLELKDLA
jgi:hypothetical protein